MKITKITILSALAFGMFACGSSETKEATTTQEDPQTEEVKTEIEVKELMVDAENSSVNWKGEIAGGMYFHTGNLAIAKGILKLENGLVSGGEIVIDMTSLSTTDENYSEDKTSEKLIGHLKSADFFDVENNPNANFVILNQEGTTINGELTIRGKMNPATVENVTISDENGVLTASGTLVFDRQLFDVAYKSAMKDMVISNDISLEITIKAKSGM